MVEETYWKEAIWRPLVGIAMGIPDFHLLVRWSNLGSIDVIPVLNDERTVLTQEQEERLGSLIRITERSLSGFAPAML